MCYPIIPTYRLLTTQIIPQAIIRSIAVEQVYFNYPLHGCVWKALIMVVKPSFFPSRRKPDLRFPFVTSSGEVFRPFVWTNKEKGHQFLKKELLAVIMRDVGEREKNRIHVVSFLSITTHWIDCLLNTHTTRDGDRVISCQTRKIKVKPGRCDCMMFAFKTVPSLLFFYLIASRRKWEVDIGHTSTVQMAHKDNRLLRDSEVLEKEHNFCPWV